MPRRAVHLALMGILLLTGTLRAQPRTKAARGLAGESPNIILILSDDQRWDTEGNVAPYMPADVMPLLDLRLRQSGLVFNNAFATNPICCPVRASVLSGGYSSIQTGVIGNRWPNGGARRFFDRRTLPTLLGAKGYRTALIGKYLNEWEQLDGYTSQGEYVPPGKYVPPGWDTFVSKPNIDDWYRYPFVVGSSPSHDLTSGVLLPFEVASLATYLASPRAAGIPPSVKSYLQSLDMSNLPYVTDFEKDVALGFLADAHRSPKPFFMMIAAEACHGPATPEPEDAHLYTDFTYQARAWGEADLSDKPEHVQLGSREFDNAYNGGGIFGISPDEYFRDQLRSLRSLDRLVDEVVTAVDQDPALRRRTVIFYASDSGLLWGTHRLFGKQAPYEESIRVPLIMRMPGAAPRSVDALVATDLDIAATILDLAGYSAPERDQMRLDGRSLLPFATEPSPPWRQDLLLQGYRYGHIRTLRPTWAALRTETYKMVLHDYLSAAVPQEELYDLVQDVYELTSVHGDVTHRTIRDAMVAELQLRRGLCIEGFHGAFGELRSGQVNAPYQHQLLAVGGLAPYRFELFDDPGFRPGCPVGLPAGLTLDSTGLISGTPLEAGCREVAIRLIDSSASPNHGGPQWCVVPLQIVIGP